MTLPVVFALALCCATWGGVAAAGAALLPSYQLLLPYPGSPIATPVATSVGAPAGRVLVLLPSGSPAPLSRAALDAAHQQVEAAATGRASQLPPQPTRADFQAQAQVQAQAPAGRAGFQGPPRSRPDFQQQAARRTDLQAQPDYQVATDGRSEYAAASGSQAMRPAGGLGRALQQPQPYQALAAEYRFRQQLEQQQLQEASYQPLATEYQYRQQQRPSYQGVSSQYQYRQQPAQARADYRPGPYPLPAPYSAARADLAQQQQQQQQQDYQQQSYQQQSGAYEAPRSELRALLPAPQQRQPQGLLPGQEYSVNFEGDGFGYGYTIRGDPESQRAF